jgi:hypothetical protein
MLMVFIICFGAAVTVWWLVDELEYRQSDSYRRTIPSDPTRRENQPSGYMTNDLQPVTLQQMQTSHTRKGDPMT